MKDSRVEDNILSNIHEKIKSGFYLDKISIDADGVKAYKEENYIRLVFIPGIHLDNGSIIERGGDYVSVYLPLPLRFNEKWFKKYKKLNLTEESIKDFEAEEYLK